MRNILFILILSGCVCGSVFGGQLLVEAESFAQKGGWKVDQQFIDIMGSPYLLAHGMGKPVGNAVTTVDFPETGTYFLWVRTKDWVPGSWDAPGRFKVIIDGEPVETVFGTQAGWGWQKGGNVSITKKKVKLELKDLTGFDGRCDAIYFSTNEKAEPPSIQKTMQAWRNRLLGIPAVPKSAGKFDVVIVGGGIAGCAAALAAEQQGLDVALVHDRPVLGGNASCEVRVHTEGIHGKGGHILKGLDTEWWPNGSARAKHDTIKRHKTMDDAKGVKQFLSWRAYDANTKGNKITSVDAMHIETGKRLRFEAPVFIDCTGDGWIGYWAGAEYNYGRESRDKYGESWDKHGDEWSPKEPDNRTMGSSVLWNSYKTATPVEFPEVPWAMDVAKDKKAINGEWYWEYISNDKHQIYDAEEIRDHVLRAIFGSFYNAKQNPKNANVALKWVAYIAGKRESRRLVGDYIYTQKDALSNKYFRDTVVEERRKVDLHYRKGKKYDFLTRAFYRNPGGKYYVPFRSLYSKDIENLMMAGRCFSCSHVGLGGPRVMNTTGQMGIAVGYAASLCVNYDTTPRGVYEKHIDQLRGLIGYSERAGNR